MTDQPTTPAPPAYEPPAAPAAPAAPPAAPVPAPLPETPALSSADKPATAPTPAPETPAAPAPSKAPSLKVGQIVSYVEDNFGFEVSRYGLVVALDSNVDLGDNDEGDFARVVALGASAHFPLDKLTAQD